jgi:hypothetical protein
MPNSLARVGPSLEIIRMWKNVALHKVEKQRVSKENISE